MRHTTSTSTLYCAILYCTVLYCRYGRVVTLLATRPITSGEEITVNYNYNMAVAPAW